MEATEITPDGQVYLTTGIGSAPTFLQCAEKVVIELNAYHSPRLREMADILVLPPPPHRAPSRFTTRSTGSAGPMPKSIRLR